MLMWEKTEKERYLQKERKNEAKEKDANKEGNTLVRKKDIKMLEGREKNGEKDGNRVREITN